MKLKHLIVSGFAICGLLTGCLSEPDFEPVLDDDGNPLEVRLFNEIKQVPVTRVNDEGFCDGDEVGVYVVNYVDGAPGTLEAEDNQADNVKYTLDEASGVWTPETTVYYLDKTTKVDIYGYYPYAEPTDVEAYPFEIAKDQSRDAENGKLGGYEASDFLWAMAAEVSPTTSKIVLTFNHIMAGVTVTIVEGEGFAEGEFDGLDKAVLVTNTKRDTRIDFSTGTVTAVGDTPTTGTIPYKKDDDFRAIVAPQTVAAETPLFSLTVGGLPYVFTKSEDFTYAPGKLHKFSIQVDKKDSGTIEFKVLNESITAWESESFTHDGTAREYVVVNCEEAGALSNAIAAAGLDYTKVKNLKITGNVNANDFFFMRDNMTLLQAVNMKEVKIEATQISYTEYYANEIPYKAFYNKQYLVRFVFPDSVESIGISAFSGTNISGALIFPEGLTRIGGSSFENLRITSLSLPNSLKEIGSSAFSNCKYLTGQLILPVSITAIHSHAFSSCVNLTRELYLPETLEILGSAAFEGCGFSGSIKIPPKVNKIESYLFNNCNKLDGELILHDEILSIGRQAFSNSSGSIYGGFSGTLKLPENLISIGEQAFYCCRFSHIDELPESLSVIGEYAFLSCSGFSNLIIPDNISLISAGAFAGTSIHSLSLPNTISYIASKAFSSCYSLTLIVSESVTPPTITDDTFESVNKDNVTLEVPDAVVNSYASVEGWKEFARITAHHDFSISRRLFRTLNASDSKTLVLRAPSEMSWKVESCPDWVTVNPTEGTGKQEVVVTVNEMAVADAAEVTYEQMNSSGTYEDVSFTGRRGEVVFLLEDKDYRSTMTVEQYNYAPDGTIIGDGTVITNQTHSQGNGVNLVFMGDCFDAKDISEGTYLDAVNEAIGYFFDLAPYKQYKDYFNIYTIIGLSADSGNVLAELGNRESKFGCGYGLEPNEKIVFDYSKKIDDLVLNNALMTVVVNSNLPSGQTYLWADGTTISCVPALSRYFEEIVWHEVGGHGFGKLADEHILFPTFISLENTHEINIYKSLGYYENISLEGNFSTVPWRHLMEDSKYSDLVDIYEGGYEYLRGVFRSEPNSCMNNNVPYYSAISREAIVKRIMEYAGEEYSFDTFKANDVMTTTDEETKSGVVSMGMSFPVRQQHGPVYMGEKPEFKKN